MLVTPIKEAFPTIRNFPDCPAGDRVAVLIRLFPSNTTEADKRRIQMSLWCMRALLLNTDMTEYEVQPVFHIKENFAPFALPILRDAGVPAQSIIIFPDDLCRKEPHVRENNWQAAAPILDTQLDCFQHIIVVDADMFAIIPNGVDAKIPLVKTSLDCFDSNDITMSYGWRKMKNKEVVKSWIRVFGGDVEKWIQAAAKWCDCSPEVVSDIMFSEDPEALKPGHNGMYINMPMSYLSREPGFREFIRGCSAEMGHEEVALAIWFLRRFIKTDERLPLNSLEDKIYRALDLPEFSRYYNQNIPFLYHPEPLASLRDKAPEFAQFLGGNPDEVEEFAVNCKYWETHNARYQEQNPC